MGQEILYCFKCRKRIVSADFARGQAYQVGNNASCSACASEFLQTLGPKDREALLAKMFKATQERQKIPGEHPPVPASDRRTSTGHIPVLKAPSPAPQGTGLAVGISIAVAVVIVVVVLLSKSGPEPAVRPAPVAARPAPPPEENPRQAAARLALQKARQFARDNPRDLQGQIQSWERAAGTAEKTPLYEEARRELGDLILRRKESVTRELAELEETSRPLLAGDSLKAATDLYLAAKKRHDLPEWSLAIDRRLNDIRETATKRYAPAKEAALAALQRGAPKEVQAFRDRVVLWGIPELIADLETLPSPAVEERPWKALLTADCLLGREAGGWIFENGVLVKDPKNEQAGLTKFRFGDGEIRMRFELGNASSVRWTLRHGTGVEGYATKIQNRALEELGPGPHEVVFTCKGDEVRGTINGKPLAVSSGKAREGHLQFNSSPGAVFRILSLDFRPVP